MALSGDTQKIKERLMARAMTVPHDFRRMLGFPCIVLPHKWVKEELRGTIKSATIDTVTIEIPFPGRSTQRKVFQDFSLIIPICYDIRKPDMRDLLDFDRLWGPFPGRYKIDIVDASGGERTDNMIPTIFAQTKPGLIVATPIGSPLITWWDNKKYYSGQMPEKFVKFKPVKMGLTDDLVEYLRNNGSKTINWIRVSSMSSNNDLHIARKWLSRLRSEGVSIPRWGDFGDGTIKREN